MILTGQEIIDQYNLGNIEITNFDTKWVEPNSYAVHLGEDLVVFPKGEVIDPRKEMPCKKMRIPESGVELSPKKFYLGHTSEVVGGKAYAAELYANLSTALCGIFIQTSAPLGHTGAAIRWTLEIVVVEPVIVYPGMKIGKVCFWHNEGDIKPYTGRYRSSTTVVPSKIILDKDYDTNR